MIYDPKDLTSDPAYDDANFEDRDLDIDLDDDTVALTKADVERFRRQQWHATRRTLAKLETIRRQGAWIIWLLVVIAVWTVFF